MKKIKSANNQLFDQILSVNKQRENEFNNGQDGAIILSLLVMFFVPFLLLNAARNFFGIDYNIGSVVSMLVLSTIITVGLYNKFKIGTQFAEKHIVLNQLLARYKPKDTQEYNMMQEERKLDPSNFYSIVANWADTERLRYTV